MNTKNPRRLSQAGFSLIEALIAMLVLAFGMLAIASFQTNLSRNSDIAKQRAEATRLAQERIEELRSFASFAGYAALAAGSDTLTGISNVTFTRAWSFPGGSTPADPQRVLKVAVEWTDRTGEAQTEAAGRGVVLMSVIAEADATEGAGLALPPPVDGSGIIRRPLARNISIPIPSVMLGGANSGYSTLGWGGASGGWLVFDNVSGDVVYKCTTQPDDTTNIPSTCTAVLGYLLLGFINGPWVSSVTGATIDNALPVGVTSECYVADALDPNNGNPISGYKLYSCLVQAVDHDSNSTTPRQWSGRLTLQGGPTGTQRVCRYNGNSSDNNGTYQSVTLSLDNQNYLLRSSGGCPSGTALHQQP
jgi:type IV pilus modification protein PilV